MSFTFEFLSIASKISGRILRPLDLGLDYLVSLIPFPLGTKDLFKLVLLGLRAALDFLIVEHIFIM